MKRNPLAKEDFFDPASLALDDDEGEAPLKIVDFGQITPGGIEALDLESPHRFQSQFNDPLQELSLDNFSPEAAPAGFARAKMAEDLFHLVNSTKLFQDLATQALAIIANSVGARFAALLEIDQMKMEFFFRASLGSDREKLAGVRLPCNSGFAGSVLAKGNAELVKGVQADPRFKSTIQHLAGTEVFQEAMAAPIFIGGRAFGVIQVFKADSGISFDESSLETLRSGALMLTKVFETRFLLSKIARKNGS
jgi:transcriptional regulator with GAF, ATPase, and Fis domain